MSFKKAVSLIKENNNFLISSHINPEADAIGSELGFLNLLRKLGKQGIIVNESNLPVECRELPGVKEIKQFPLAKVNGFGYGKPNPACPAGRHGLVANGFDCGVYLDSGEASRVGKVDSLLSKARRTLNIDHHFSNKRFAGVNWVDPSASCTCEMVFRLYKHFRVEIDADAALALYAGIIADTGSFHYSNTAVSTHQIAAQLLKTGISPPKIYNMLFENNTLGSIRLLGQVLLAMESDCNGQIVWAEIPATRRVSKDTRRVALPTKRFPDVDLAEEVLGLMRSIKGVELAIIFKEARNKNDQARINFRSQTVFDCNRLASEFGGGGHKNASGATVNGNLREIKRKILKRAKEMMER